MPQLTRMLLLDTVHTALAAQPWVNALWEGGSAAFARDDQWSDVDLQADVPDAQVVETFAVVEAALGKVAKTELVFVVPEPAWHGHSQRFYRFADAPPWLILDFCVIRQGNPNKLIEPELHGTARVLFDRTGLFRQPPKIDRMALETKLQARLAQLTVRFELFQVLVIKEVWRQHPLDAAYFYQSLTLAPLIALLRLKHDPLRHDWSARYLHHVLPAEAAAKLTRLTYLADSAEIPAKQTEATAWFRQLAAELKAQPRLVPA
ncbi:MAG: hypothetical protein KIT44_04170 [Opitutaceae bacterium]|nr:hypothetical protein [Opitutaceae bacterium]